MASSFPVPQVDHLPPPARHLALSCLAAVAEAVASFLPLGSSPYLALPHPFLVLQAQYQAAAEVGGACHSAGNGVPYPQVQAALPEPFLDAGVAAGSVQGEENEVAVVE